MGKLKLPGCQGKQTVCCLQWAFIKGGTSLHFETIVLLAFFPFGAAYILLQDRMMEFTFEVIPGFKYVCLFMFPILLLCTLYLNLPNALKGQFSSVIQVCPALWDLRNCSMSGFPVHYQLPEPTQTHVHRVGDAIQLSHPLSSPSSAFNLSQHQDLFQRLSRVFSNITVQKHQFFSTQLSL